MKYRVGDTVRVIRNCADADINIGEIGTIFEVKKRIFAFPYKVEFKTVDSGEFCEVFSEEEIELYV